MKRRIIISLVMVLLLCCACERTSPAAAQLQKLLPAINTYPTQNAMPVLRRGENLLFTGTDGIYTIDKNGQTEKVLDAHRPTLLYPGDTDTLYFAAQNKQTGSYGIFRSVGGAAAQQLWDSKEQETFQKPITKDYFDYIEDFFVTDNYIVLSGFWEILTVSLATGQVCARAEISQELFSMCPAGGDAILYLGREDGGTTLERMDAATGHTEKLHSRAFSEGAYVQLFCDGDTVYYTTRDPYMLWRWNPNGADTCLLDFSDRPQGTFYSLSYVSDGQLYLFCHEQDYAETYTWDVFRYDMDNGVLSDSKTMRLPALGGAVFVDGTMFYDVYGDTKIKPEITVKSVRLPFADG